MIRLRDKILVSFSLLLLFAAGVGSGFLIGKRQADQSAVTSTVTTTAAAASSTDWWQKSLDSLAADLKLSAAQKASIQPLLLNTGDRMFHNRDRAMFQIHLELLAFHEAVGKQAGLLDAAQMQRLDSMRSNLRKRIEKQFPQFLKDSPLQVTATGF